MKVATVKQLIGAFGGRKRFAEVADTSPQNVDIWRREKRLPANSWVILHTEMDIAGISAPDSLWAMRTKRKRR